MSGNEFSFDFRVKLISDADYIDVRSGPTEIVRTERKFGVGIGAVADLATMRFEWLAYMAWSAWSRRLEPVDRLDFEKWLDVLDDLQVDADTVQGVKVVVTGDEAALTPEQIGDARAELERLEQVVRDARAADPLGRSASPSTGSTPAALPG